MSESDRRSEGWFRRGSWRAHFRRSLGARREPATVPAQGRGCRRPTQGFGRNAWFSGNRRRSGVICTMGQSAIDAPAIGAADSSRVGPSQAERVGGPPAGAAINRDAERPPRRTVVDIDGSPDRGRVARRVGRRQPEDVPSVRERGCRWERVGSIRAMHRARVVASAASLLLGTPSTVASTRPLHPHRHRSPPPPRPARPAATPRRPATRQRSQRSERCPQRPSTLTFL